MAEKEVPKEKDINQIVRYLTTTFNNVTSKLDRPFRGTKSGANMAYIIQTEFAYLLNELIQGPRCLLQKNIAVCNDFIDQIVQELAKESSSTESL